jgi:hypothetical protein
MEKVYWRKGDRRVNIFRTMKINRQIFSRIEFWIVLFFIIRLFGITNPPLESAHNWRQTTGLMVARNFFEIDPNILYPRLDFAGEKTGITGTEFPLFNYLIYLVALIFGYDHWYGRLISLVFTVIGTIYFYLLVRDYFNKKTAFYSTILLTCSLWFEYSRKTMPDLFSFSLVLAGIYYGLNLLLYAVLILAGILSKIPSIYILVLFIIPLLNNKLSIIRKLYFVLASFLVLVPVAGWYYYWVPYLNKTYEFDHYYMGVPFAEGIKALLNKKGNTLKQFYENAMMYSGFMVFMYGLIKLIIDRNRFLLIIFSICTLSFFILMLKMGDNFPVHSYYILIYIPVMALIAGYGIAAINNKYLVLILVAIVCLENILNQQHDFYLKKERKKFITFEKTLSSYVKSSDKIVINCSPNPSAMYYAHRKGWIATNDQLHDGNYINDLYSKGCKYVVIIKKIFGEDTNLNMSLISENETYKLYSISVP